MSDSVYVRREVHLDGTHMSSPEDLQNAFLRALELPLVHTWNPDGLHDDITSNAESAIIHWKNVSSARAQAGAACVDFLIWVIEERLAIQERYSWPEHERMVLVLE